MCQCLQKVSNTLDRLFFAIMHITSVGGKLQCVVDATVLYCMIVSASFFLKIKFISRVCLHLLLLINSKVMVRESKGLYVLKLWLVF